MNAIISAITIYPVKSSAGIALESSHIEARGLRHDRRFLLTEKKSGDFITARRYPKLIQLTCMAQDRALIVSTPDAGAVTFALEADGKDVETRIWRDLISARTVSAEADDWFSDFLGVDCQLRFMGKNSQRQVDQAYGQAGDEVSFADGFPILIIAQASLDGLNSRLAEPLPMARFRPNLVVDRCPAHAEDDWKQIRIGEVELEMVATCDRCAMTLVDPASATRDNNQEPLRTLATYRRGDDGLVYFGNNAIPRKLGTIAVGDSVEIIA